MEPPAPPTPIDDDDVADVDPDVADDAEVDVVDALDVALVLELEPDSESEQAATHKQAIAH